MPRIAAIVLAAGRSSRFREGGGLHETKLIAPVAGKPIVRRVVEAAAASRADPIIVVTGHARAAVEAALAGLPATVRHNPDFASGIASSLRVGLGAAPKECDGAVILLADMPGVTARLIDALIEAHANNPTALAVAPRQGERRGNPVLLAKELFGAASSAEGDQGARGLLASLPSERIVDIPVQGSETTFDVDTVGDLAQAQKLAGHSPFGSHD